MAKIQKKPAEKQIINPKTERQILLILGALIVLALVYFSFSYLFSGLGKVKYEGLTFAKEMYGQLPVYRYSYLVRSPSGETFQYNLFLRNNPKENKVPIEGKIAYPEGEDVLVGINGTGLIGCQNSTIAVASLSQFLANNFINIKAGSADLKEAEQKNLTYINCRIYPGNTVIIIKEGNETKITKEGANCHTIEAANCEILRAAEKFIVQSVIDMQNSSS